MIVRLFAVLLALTVFTGTVRAEEIYEDQSLSYLRHPTKVNLTYKVDEKGALVLRFVAYPALVSCSKITEMPTEVSFDTEAVDIKVDDFKFLPNPATGIQHCVSTMKAATATVKISADDLTANDVRQIRLWFGKGTLDTIRVTRRGYNVSLLGPKKPQYFFLDDSQQTDTPEPAGTNDNRNEDDAK